MLSESMQANFKDFIKQNLEIVKKKHQDVQPSNQSDKFEELKQEKKETLNVLDSVIKNMEKIDLNDKKDMFYNANEQRVSSLLSTQSSSPIKPVINQNQNYENMNHSLNLGQTETLMFTQRSDSPVNNGFNYPSL